MWAGGETGGGIESQWLTGKEGGCHGSQRIDETDIDSVTPATRKRRRFLWREFVRTVGWGGKMGVYLGKDRLYG